MKRRAFLTTAAVSTAAVATGCSNNDKYQAINVNKNKKVRLKLATSWPAHFPIMGTGVEKFVDRVKEASGGSLRIKLYPKNTLIPALQVFDAASAGQIDIFHSGPYYWKGKNSAFSLFSGAPFGFTAQEINAWMLHGGGYDLWRELYGRYNLHPFMGGNTNVQMGGWFRKPINSLEDLKGLKMRVPGLGGEVFSKLGVNSILLPAGEIYSSLERSTIDATEWVGPALDIKMGFYKVAKYYYSGWHEPGSILELTFNKRKWEKLSKEHQAILEMASNEMNNNMAYEFASENAKALPKLKEHGVDLRSFPQDVTDAAKIALREVVAENSTKNPDFKRVWESSQTFLNQAKAWSDVGIKNYLKTR
ncbi:MAG: TRAP transporter substrate-binding protein DctP [Thiovulaceae bacterium]|nr:TRAP transporter substrate-binding protein DctP [Sulfurimonadaceae bacterium]